MIQRHVWVSGRVQGVSFRASLVREVARVALAGGSRIQGFVRNLSDGRVEAVFAGEQGLVLGLVAWCRQGPIAAKVTELEVREEALDASLPEFGMLF